jgi:hypothetical protein
MEPLSEGRSTPLDGDHIGNRSSKWQDVGGGLAVISSMNKVKSSNYLLQRFLDFLRF